VHAPSYAIRTSLQLVLSHSASITDAADGGMEQRGMMPVVCVGTECGAVMWRAWRRPAVVSRLRVNVAGPGAETFDPTDLTRRPAHPSAQEYCRTCMGRIRAAEQSMREAVDEKDRARLEAAIGRGLGLGVDAARSVALQRCSSLACCYAGCFCRRACCRCVLVCSTVSNLSLLQPSLRCPTTMPPPPHRVHEAEVARSRLIAEQEMLAAQADLNAGRQWSADFTTALPTASLQADEVGEGAEAAAPQNDGSELDGAGSALPPVPTVRSMDRSPLLC
jgi:hypothetical protein